jgi:predicted Rossmann fold flavoprotein
VSTIVIGGGPAGFFAAITAREAAPDRPVLLLEKNPSVLGKVKISGGGRCNVTHACFDPRELITRYPRGGRELRGPLTRFGPAETMDWFTQRGVPLKTEDDGRVFPVSDSSASIVDALTGAAREAGVQVETRQTVTGLACEPGAFTLALADGRELRAERVLVATGGRTSSGGGADGYNLAAGLGHTIEPPVPSLFTFEIEDPLLAGLAGVAVPAEVRVSGGGKALRQTGPLLITHRGLSGPAVLLLSAWGARELHERGYAFDIEVAWLPGLRAEEVNEELQTWSRDHARATVAGGGPGGLPRRLWTALVGAAGVGDDRRWAELGREERRRLASLLTGTRLSVRGQALNKEEFVTCGGVHLNEVDFRTMQSKICPGLFLAGEVLDIDGVTGGFNFQGCWTMGWLAGMGMGAD